MAIAAVAALAGCGSTGTNGVAKKGAGSIVATAEGAVLNATSVHIQGQFTSGNQPVALDLRLEKDKGASGTVTIGTEVLELLRVGPDVYVKGDEAFYRSVLSRLGTASAPAPSAPSAPSTSGSASGSSSKSPSAAGSSSAGTSTTGTPSAGQSSSDNSIAVTAMQINYLHIGPTDAQYQTFASLTDPRQLLAQIMQGIGSLGKDGQKDIRGTKSIVLSGSKDTRVYVAIDGQPFLERVLPPGGGTLDFMDYNTPVTLNPPPPGQVVDIAKIAK
ncbi:hypothetical protein Caci_0123 [Catenulispora acidiphila DSM 44928]|uniref:Lipoprotein n=1 Tax=Catenulispora acidiphila (strain DSM 44928 / JCM 14897 / NBRC 102108 / NRRL B-24433 / ID139908) TaxID=479433 RepID=C7QHD9_CATAD|nr:hypothetical protein [Catenulispora acidiphila]ACU69078.1 hypothetical protein Caci_0123 [Catenulispora acidiphila DSM 44928]